MVVVAALVVLSLVGATAVVYSSLQAKQKKHYEAAKKALKSEDFKGAIAQFSEAGGYKDAREMAKKAETRKGLVGKYDEAASLMSQGQWNTAYELFKEIKSVDPEFRETTAKIHYLEHCPAQVQKNMADVVNVAGNWSGTIPINNLLGSQIGTITCRRGVYWEEKPEYFVNYNLSFESKDASPASVTLATCDMPSAHKEGVPFTIVSQGQQFDIGAGNWTYTISIPQLTTVTNPPASVTYPAFGSLVVTISIGLN